MIRIERKNKVFTHPYTELDSILYRGHFSKGFSQKKDYGVESIQIKRDLEVDLEQESMDVDVEPILDNMNREMVYVGGRIDRFDMFGTRESRY